MKFLPPLYFRIEVHWIDSTSKDAWDSVEEHKDAGHLITTLGYNLGVVDDFLVVVQNLDRDGGDCSCSMRIPIGCIKRVKPLI